MFTVHQYQKLNSALSVLLEIILTLMKKRGDNYVEIKVITWEKDSHGLFDYECKNLRQSHHVIQKTSLITQNRKDSNVSIHEKSPLYSQLSEEDKSSLITLGSMEIDPISDSFLFKNNFTTSSAPQIKAQDPYIVIRSLKNEEKQQKGFGLRSGDVIKFGRLEYIVRQFKDSVNTYSHGNIRMDFDTFVADPHTQQGVCKVCLSDQQTHDNFLVSPCKCKGSCEFIHLLCLKQWIQSKIVKQTQGIVDSFNFTKFQCQICKVPFPEKIIKRGQEYPMLVISKPDHPYIILQNISQKKDHRNMHLISFKGPGQALKIGRGHECQIRLSDISVSRIHAELKFQKGKFMIFDNNSKFGTLIKIQDSIPITESKTAVQVGRTVIICALKSQKKKTSDEAGFRRTK